MSLLGFLKGSSVASSKAARPTERNGNDTAAARPRVTYNCKLCGVASSVRGVVYDHIRHTHPDILDRNGNINEYRDDDTRAHA
jgi:hypothetical protein